MNVVVIGGGTGSFTVLRGLKNKVEELSAVTTVFDDGGSTGRLKDELGVLPQGDIRRCLIALAEDNVLRDLFLYRFPAKGGLSDHSFGNLFLAALADVTGSEKEAIKRASTILRVHGSVYPVSFQKSNLCAELADGRIIRGESHIGDRQDTTAIKRVWLDPPAEANPEALTAIKDADLIVIGPGDLYTSVIPNLLASGVAAAITTSKAKKAYVCNLMTKPGETHAYSASQHVSALIAYGVKPDVVVCNTAQGNTELVQLYAAKNQHPVVVDAPQLLKLGVGLACSDIMSAPELIRHDSEKLARLLLSLPEQKKNSHD